MSPRSLSCKDCHLPVPSLAMHVRRVQTSASCRHAFLSAPAVLQRCTHRVACTEAHACTHAHAITHTKILTHCKHTGDDTTHTHLSTHTIAYKLAWAHMNTHARTTSHACIRTHIRNLACTHAHSTHSQTQRTRLLSHIL